jgi:hypothetical protein
MGGLLGAARRGGLIDKMVPQVGRNGPDVPPVERGAATLAVRRDPKTWVNLGAHLLYGVSVQIVVEEMLQQRDHRATVDAGRHPTRVG